MNFKSTRGTGTAVSAAQAIKQGLAEDGGLFVPESLPVLTDADFTELSLQTYAERAAKILGMFLSDYTEEELLRDCEEAYGEESFPGGAAPLVPLHEGIEMLELWHGPTAAFKDMALQIMPRLLSRNYPESLVRKIFFDNAKSFLRRNLPL